jgi:hypothetical protein
MPEVALISDGQEVLRLAQVQRRQRRTPYSGMPINST